MLETLRRAVLLTHVPEVFLRAVMLKRRPLDIGILRRKQSIALVRLVFRLLYSFRRHLELIDHTLGHEPVGIGVCLLPASQKARLLGHRDGWQPVRPDDHVFLVPFDSTTCRLHYVQVGSLLGVIDRITRLHVLSLLRQLSIRASI